MVSSVSSLPYFSYLDQLQGKQATVPAPTTSSTPASNTNSTSSSLVSSLLGKGGFAPSVLGLLQENEGGFDSVSTLFGGKTVTNNGVARLYANLYNNSVASALQEAKLENPKAAVKTASATFTLIADSTKASTAYNQTLQQNAAIVLAQGKVQTIALIS